MSDYYDEASVQRRNERIAKMRKEKERQAKIRARVRILAPVLLLFLLVLCILMIVARKKAEVSKEIPIVAEEPVSTISVKNEIDYNQIQREEEEQERLEAQEKAEAIKEFDIHTTDKTTSPNEAVVSEKALVYDISSGDIIVERGYKEKIVPASMTKILTVLTAADYITDLEDTFVITTEITDYGYSHDCSSVGFADGERVTVRDLMYGTILPSGADAAVGLATYVAGSQEEFVELMNKKLEDLGISKTSHFTNCVGVYDDELYTTLYDMGKILQAAVENEMCREALSAHTYTTSSTEQHPDGITISNWFLRRIEDKDTGGEVICAKTGFVVESKNCAASYQKYNDGREYICVTAGSTSSWRCIYDHVELYNQCK